MAKFIPVEPEKWAEMVKALALVAEMDKTINASQAECRRLKAEVERLTAEVSYDNRVQLHVDKLAAEFTQYEVERLKAEVERLRKAGDDLHKSMFECGPNEMAEAYHHDEWWKSYYAWNAAKEGKQS